jgi:steroid delta-isomerase-like uncharacterized protein
MALVGVALPILPGKREEFDTFIQDLHETHWDEFVALRRKLGARERTFLQETPHGDIVIVTIEAPDPGSVLADLGAGSDDFTTWFVERVETIHGVNLRQLPPEASPKLIADTGPVDNKAVVRRFFEEILTGSNPEAQTDIVSDDYVNHGFGGPGGPLPKAEAMALARTWFEAFPDLAIEVHEMIEEGDTIVTRSTITGTQAGEFMGIPATGQKINVSALSLHRVRGGKIVEDRPGVDVFTMLQQLGTVSAPATP